MGYKFKTEVQLGEKEKEWDRKLRVNYKNDGNERPYKMSDN